MRKKQFRPLNLFYIIFTIVMCISSLLLYLYTDARRIEAEKTSDLITDTSNVMQEVSLNFKVVMDTYPMHFLDADLNKALQDLDDYNTPGYVENAQYILKAIYYIIYGNHLISDVGFVRSNQQLLASTTMSDMDREMVEEEIMRYPAGKSYQISPVYDNQSIIYDRQRILLTREIFKMDDRTRVGYMVYFIDFPALLEIMERTKLPPEEHLGMMVLSDTQKIYDQREDAQSGKIEQKVRTFSHEIGDKGKIERESDIDGKKYILSLERDPISGWIFVSYYCQNRFFMESIVRNIWFIVFMVVLCFAMVIIQLRSFHFLNETVSHLNQAMAVMENGKFVQLDKRFEKNRELTDVVTGFNRMSSSLKRMIQENYVEQLKRKEAELKMLHFQINPHFLYNTLNLISSLAVLDGNDKIVSITDSMSEMFRYNMQGEYLVKVEDEINLIKRYFAIQKLRFPKKFTVQYDLDEELLGCSIGKFTLQPLVENIFVHNRAKGKLNIKISLQKVNEETFTITIWDSGFGIKPNRLKELNEQLEKTDTDMGDSIGIFNVNSRMKKRAGGIYGLKLYSEAGEWTAVVLTLPVHG